MTPQSFRFILRFLLIQLFVFFLSSCFTSFSAQSVKTPDSFEVTRVRKLSSRDPKKLANALIQGKTTDQEKFDVIFAWVARNIRYDYKYYNAGKATNAHTPLKRVLKKKRGLCLDYARLMDTLCFYAGLENVTITGYSKEIYFDLNDSVYFDNHAWNAVKLNNLWYLYDVTWCAGYSEMSYTRLGEWRLRQVDKLNSKTKSEEVFLSRKKYKYDFCDKFENKKRYSFSRDVLRRIPRILIWLLDSPPYFIKTRFRRKISIEYYLSNPDKFAVTHFPNDSIWSLTSRITNPKLFSADSAYFDMALLPKVDLNISGRLCLECDNYYAADEETKDKLLVNSVRKNNPKNHLVPSYYDYNRALEYCEKAIDEMDSLPKMLLVDTTIQFVKDGKNELRQAKTLNLKNYRFQKNKHAKKLKALTADNKKKISYLKAIFSSIKKRRRTIYSLLSKSMRINSQNWDKDDALQAIFKKPVKEKKMTDEQEDKLLANYLAHKASLDSLNLMILQLEDSVEQDYSLLFKSLIVNQSLISPITASFCIEGNLRKLNLLDIGDKTVFDLRAKINERILSFSSTVNSDLLAVSDTLYDESMLLFKTMSQQNNMKLKAAKELVQLVAQGVLSNEELAQFQTIVQLDLERESCRGIDFQNAIIEIKQAFNEFVRLNPRLNHFINYNSAAEKIRYNQVCKILLREYKRLNALVKQNTILLNRVKGMAVADKTRYNAQKRKEK